MSGHLIHQIVRVAVAAPKDAPTVESAFGIRFRPSTIQYETLKTTEVGLIETVTLFASAGDDYINVSFFTDHEAAPAWVPEPPEQYKALLATLKEVADA